MFVSGFSGIDAVVNNGPIGGGVNEESDNEYLARFRAYLLGLGKSNIYGLISGALVNPALRSVSVVEHFLPAPASTTPPCIWTTGSAPCRAQSSRK